MEIISITTLVTFFLTSLVVELTPGPNMAYLTLLSARRGRKAGFYAVAGVALGLAIVGALAAVGLATIVAQNQGLFQIIRWAGVFYLVWLGFDSWREAYRPVGEIGVAERNLVDFRRGLVTNLLNPKAAVFYLAVLPNFLPSDASGWGFGLLAAVYVFAATLVHTVIVVAAGTLKPYFVRDDRRKVLGGVFGILLVLVAVWMAVSTR